MSLSVIHATLPYRVLFLPEHFHIYILVYMDVYMYKYLYVHTFSLYLLHTFAHTLKSNVHLWETINVINMTSNLFRKDCHFEAIILKL